MQRNLVGYNPQGRKQLNMTEATQHIEEEKGGS